jgi:hypothetical protein
MTTVEYQVGASSDDAEETQSSGSVNLTRNYHAFGDYVDPVDIGLRFTGVTIPAGATIDTAYIIFVADADDSGTNLYTDWWGEDGASPSTFTTGTNDISGRTPTTASVAWDGPETWSTGNPYNSPELKTIIQELVDSYDYSSGAPIVLFNIYDSGNGERLAVAYDQTPGDAPTLHIEYTEAGGGVEIEVVMHHRQQQEMS